MRYHYIYRRCIEFGVEFGITVSFMVRGKLARMIFSLHRKIVFDMVSGLCATLELSVGITFPWL